MSGIQAGDMRQNARDEIRLSIIADHDVSPAGTKDDRVGTGAANDNVVIANGDMIIAAKRSVHGNDFGDDRCAQRLEWIEAPFGLPRDGHGSIGAKDDAGSAAGDGDGVWRGCRSEIVDREQAAQNIHSET